VVLSRVTPGSAQPFAVTEPEDRRNDEQHGLIERAGDRRQAESSEPAEPARQPAVADQEAHGADDSFDACQLRDPLPDRPLDHRYCEEDRAEDENRAIASSGCGESGERQERGEQR
jgi:hypothetical protein